MVGTRMTDGVDLISSLPDEVLIHILSFVSTRDAVHTCILSKRWQHIWASVSVLKFDFKEFWPYELDYELVESVPKFERFVKSVLQNREPSRLDRFEHHFYCRFILPCIPQALGDCIVDAMKFEPCVCTISVHVGEYLNLDINPMFNCASLKHLKLWLLAGFRKSITPCSINLPFLKSLNLGFVKISDEFLKQLFLGSLVLEELVLRCCSMQTTEISSNTLKKLVFHGPVSLQEVGRLQICTPNLLYLRTDFFRKGDILLQNMSSLVYASISHVGQCKYDMYITDGPNILNSLSNVARLSLTQLNCVKLKVLEKDIPNFPSFNNLRRLKLGRWHMCNYFDLIACFLQHSPNLQKLTLHHTDPQNPDLLLETSQEKRRSLKLQREYLEMVKIVKHRKDDGLLGRLIDKLLTHVKVIGKIVT